MNTIAWGFAASVIGGQIIFAPLLEFARWKLGNPTRRTWWISFVTGITERLFVTTLVIWAPGFVAAFIGGWTVAKFAAGWGRIAKGMPLIRASHIMALIGTAYSYAIAIAAGLWAHPASAAYFMKAGISN